MVVVKTAKEQHTTYEDDSNEAVIIEGNAYRLLKMGKHLSKQRGIELQEEVDKIREEW